MAKIKNDVKRDARINLAFTSEMKETLERIAKLNDISVNALIESICLAYISTHADTVAEYEKLRNQIRSKFIPAGNFDA